METTLRLSNGTKIKIIPPALQTPSDRSFYAKYIQRLLEDDGLEPKKLS